MVFIKRIKKGSHVYLAEVKSVRKGGNVRHEFIRYVGKEVDNERILSGNIASAKVTKVSIYGPLLALHELSSEIGLADILGEYAPEMLSLVYAHCIQPDSLTKITDWYERTDLNHLLDLSSLTEKKLLEAMDFYTPERRESIQKDIFNRLQDTYQVKCNGIFYDLTDIYFYGKNCPLAVRGHNSQGLKYPQMQVGLAVTSKEAFPIFHRCFPGNISDKKTVSEVMLACKEYNIADVTIAWDRGVTSALNVEDMKRINVNVICGVPLSEKLKKIVDKHKNIEQITNRIQLTETTFYAVSQPYRLGKTVGTLIICHNLRMKETMRDERHRRILEAKAERSAENIPIPKHLKKYFLKNGLNQTAISGAERYDGVSLVFSTKKLSAEEIIRTYFEKDKVEKAFKALKGITCIRPIRHWLERRVKTHIFICYLSYLLLSVFDHKLKKAGEKISAVDALQQLSTAYKIHIVDAKGSNSFEKTVAYTKEQEDILRAINPALIKV